MTYTSKIVIIITMEGMYKIVREESGIPVYVDVKKINDGYYGVEDLETGTKSVINSSVCKTWLSGDPNNIGHHIEKLEYHPLKKRVDKIILFSIRIGKDISR